MSYFVRIRGKAFGPFDGNQLVDMKTKGKLGKTSEISENRIDWFPAEELDFLFPQVAAPDPPVRETTDSGVHPTAPAANEAADWFYSVNGTEGYGPITTTALIQMIQSDKLTGESYVWQQGQHARHLKTEIAFSGYLFPPSSFSPSSSASQGMGVSGTGPSAAGPSPGVGRFCSACGNPIVPTAMMCPRCGSPVARSFISQFPSSSLGTGYIDVLKRYSDFTGRARRREYWSFVLINDVLIPFFVFVLVFLIAVLSFTGTNFQAVLNSLMLASEPGNNLPASITAAAFLIQCVLGLHLVFHLAVLIPTLAVCVRRLHDTGNSGWMILLLFVPVVGAIALFVFLVQDTQPGDNMYGLNPKYATT